MDSAMVKRFFIIVMLMLFQLVATQIIVVGDASARVEVWTSKVIPMERVPGRIAFAPAAKKIFILCPGGVLKVYTDDGILLDTLAVSKTSIDIAVSPDGSRLYLVDGDNKQLAILDIVHFVKLQTERAPFFKGPENAPVTIVEFSDFQCPYCSRLNPVLKQVLTKYPRQVKLVYKFLPLLGMHKLAMPAALAAQAAGRQGKFWEYHDALLASYRELSEGKFLAIARSLGLDMDQFLRDRKDPRLVNVVRKDMQEAEKNQVKGVPTIFINGYKLKQRSLKDFDDAIQRELKKVH